MPPRKDLCRNFQRGSCQYGDRCKFLHVTPQQSKANSFGFGAQNGNPFQWTNQQQQAPNPFGFGVQNNNQSRGGNEFGSKPNQFKPFENKWTRFSPLNNSNSSSARPSANQPQPSEHKCTDPESCKRIIAEDLENEKPLWKLTCYAHNRYGPCDVVGDISFEELRALAYDEAKSGKNLQFIVERERNLLSSKLAEFQNLLQKPYTVSSVATPGTQNLFGGGSSNVAVATPGTQNLFGGGSSNVAVTSNFSQLNTSLNTRSAATPSYAFGQSNSFQNNNNQSSGMLQLNSSSLNAPGTISSLAPQQSARNPFSFGSASTNQNSVGARSNPFSSLANSSQTGNVFNKSFNLMNNGTASASSVVAQASISAPLISTMSKESANVDDGIWKKPEWKWNAGEIPEDPPPDIFIY